MENNILPYSTKLKQAMEEIKEVMKKYDIGGLVVLHTPGYIENYMKINPSYSALEFKDKKHILMKGKDNYKSDKYTHIQAVENSLNLLKSICDVTAITIYPIMEASQSMDVFYNATHQIGSNTSHDQLFN